ncbi:MAG: cation diffusion facilitator family transporter [Longimicrobiales bacterium]
MTRPGDPAERARQVRAVLRRVLWMNVGVIALKAGVLWLSGALSVMAELLHSSLDAANNVFALAFASVAAQEPDEDHPYGHRKFETLGALALVGVLSVTVFELLKSAAVRLGGQPAHPPDVGYPALALLALSLGAGVAITRYESRVGKRLGSDLLLADAAHTRADVLATVAVLLGLVAVRLGYPLADPIVTILVAALVARTGWGIVKETVPVLVDTRAMPPERIESLCLEVDGVRSAYGIRSRGRSGDVFAELTIAVDADLDVAASHAIADQVEHHVATGIAAREVMVHVEPAG